MSIAAILEDLAQMFRTRWGERIRFELLAPPAEELRLDRDQISQALWALLQNAADAALERSAAPRVRLEATVDARRCTFRVSDNGSGVAPMETEEIFRAFHTTKADGSGIGLSVVRHIAKAHGGEVQLQPPIPLSRPASPSISRCGCEREDLCRGADRPGRALVARAAGLAHPCRLLYLPLTPCLPPRSILRPRRPAAWGAW